jgi:hypothetical protein
VLILKGLRIAPINRRACGDGAMHSFTWRYYIIKVMCRSSGKLRRGHVGDVVRGRGESLGKRDGSHPTLVPIGFVGEGAHGSAEDHELVVDGGAIRMLRRRREPPSERETWRADDCVAAI